MRIRVRKMSHKARSSVTPTRARSSLADADEFVAAARQNLDAGYTLAAASLAAHAGSAPETRPAAHVPVNARQVRMTGKLMGKDGVT